MFIHDLLEKLNVVDTSAAMLYMDMNFDQTDNYDQIEWDVKVFRKTHVEIATIRLVTGRFIVTEFIHKHMEITAQSDPLTEVIQRIELAMKLSLNLNLN